MFGLFSRKCHFCRRKGKTPYIYLNDQGKKIHVCQTCIGYAERRAYRKIKH